MTEGEELEKLRHERKGILQSFRNAIVEWDDPGTQTLILRIRVTREFYSALSSFPDSTKEGE